MSIVRHAECPCGQLAIDCAGDPIRVSICHCLDCQRRSGSVLAAQARYARGAVHVTGQAREWARVGSSGTAAIQSFCPTCGVSLFYRLDREPDVFAVATGAFADPDFPPPDYSVYEDRKHPWLAIVGDGIEHYA